jgi:hypothetical protein
MRAIDLPDLARGARIELLAEAIQSGNKARSLGLWAELSADERAEIGPMMLAVLGGGESR